MYKFKTLSDDPPIVGIMHHKNNGYCFVKCFGPDAYYMAQGITRFLNSPNGKYSFLQLEQSSEILTSKELDAT